MVDAFYEAQHLEDTGGIRAHKNHKITQDLTKIKMGLKS